MSLDATAFGQPLNVDHLPDGFVPLEAVVVVKGLDSDGDNVVYRCATDGLSTWEALGMAVTLVDNLRHGLSSDDD